MTWVTQMTSGDDDGGGTPLRKDSDPAGSGVIGGSLELFNNPFDD
ncbi:MAG: hypothetical protein BMS9Abin02_1934 [Anaerolineae bacterium]|nr:MAG: hypothetical protein BMS9Abin02_1934 [Anaerolineae bacterium]